MLAREKRRKRLKRAIDAIYKGHASLVREYDGRFTITGRPFIASTVSQERLRIDVSNIRAYVNNNNNTKFTLASDAATQCADTHMRLVKSELLRKHRGLDKEFFKDYRSRFYFFVFGEVYHTEFK